MVVWGLFPFFSQVLVFLTDAHIAGGSSVYTCLKCCSFVCLCDVELWCLNLLHFLTQMMCLSKRIWRIELICGNRNSFKVSLYFLSRALSLVGVIIKTQVSHFQSSFHLYHTREIQHGLFKRRYHTVCLESSLVVAAAPVISGLCRHDQASMSCHSRRMHAAMSWSGKVSVCRFVFFLVGLLFKHSGQLWWCLAGQTGDPVSLAE